MDGDWVDRLEPKLGWLAVPGLPLYLSAMTAFVAILSAVKPEFRYALELEPAGLLHGQVWRALTFLVVPPPAGPLWLFLWLALLYSCLSALEAAWGDFKTTMYVAVGALCTVAGSLAVREGMDPTMVHLSTFLAFARLLPEREVLVMFVFPVKVRWLAALAGLLVAVEFVTEGAPGKVYLASGLCSYFLFFGRGHWLDLRAAWRRRGR
jgi:hypothetical protein